MADKIAALPALNKAKLLIIWRENFYKSPPPKLRKELMVPILAYRMQEKEYGGLSHSARKRLRDIARSIASEKRPQKEVPPNSEKGTRLLRSWHGEVHEVIVTDAGYGYRGSTFTSLSKIAREITGTQWSGPLFFGTKKKA
ncbi:MAG: DUF2924 domain-containing protein [Acidobacteriaceae bacterium]